MEFSKRGKLIIVAASIMIAFEIYVVLSMARGPGN